MQVTPEFSTHGTRDIHGSHGSCRIERLQDHCTCFVSFRPTYAGLVSAGALFKLFLEGGKFSLLFFNATGLLKNWKNTTLCVTVVI